jgi:hypothetical protein
MMIVSWIVTAAVAEAAHRPEAAREPTAGIRVVQPVVD